MRRTILLCSAVLTAAAPEIRNPWVRASLPHQDSTAAYLTIASDRADTLLSVRTPAAAMAMLHATTTQGSMSGMTDIESLAVPAGHPVALAPRGTHIMLMGLKQKLVAGGSVMLTLHFARAGDVTVAAPVQTLPP